MLDDSPAEAPPIDAHGSLSDPEGTGSLLTALRQVYGFDAFRPHQEEIIRDALAGRDVLAILPTGGGKSLCFQLPAVLREGLTLVVSPLIALMKDQVDTVTAAGIPATFLSSTLDFEEAKERLTGLRRGHYRLLYVAPERLLLPGFLAMLRELSVHLIAVDEAHCISQWGHDFRPEYRQIADLRELFPRAPVMALSATATDRVRADIIESLRLREPRCVVASFNRPNLLYRVEPKNGAIRQLVKLCRRRPGESGIVYAHSRSSVEHIAHRLREEHIDAAAYHAGLPPEERSRIQEAFTRDDLRVICATVAFGMGIHKPNVRFVVHHDLPGDIESYYQETGRAGRDGLTSECLLLFNPGDSVKKALFVDRKTDPGDRAQARRRLQEMVSFAESNECRRKALLGYFGETGALEPCGACDNCLSPPERYDGTIATQKLMSCVLRIQQQSHVSMGLTHVVDVLLGADNAKIRRMGHSDLSTYGIGKEHSKKEWLAIGRELLRLGLLRLSEEQYPVLNVTKEGRETLSKRKAVMLARPSARAKVAAKSPLSGDLNFDEGLFDKLRKLRRQLADEANVPAYVIFSDVSLRQMASLCPTDGEAFVQVHGVGRKKLDDFGSVFMNTIREHIAHRVGLSDAE